MKHRHLIALVGLALIAMLILAACGEEPTKPASTTTAAATTAATSEAGLPRPAKKDRYKIGFAQTDNNNPWRIAHTKSMQDEAAKRGWELIYTDAGGSAAKQLTDMDMLISSKVDAIFLTPVQQDKSVPAILKAKAAGIPVILVGRSIDPALAQAGRDYLTFIGADYVEQGRQAANWLIKATDGKAKIIQLEGTAGAATATDRQKGFEEVIKGQPSMQIIASKSGNFTRSEGRQVMETLLGSNPGVTAVFSQNDEMAIGAIAALEAGGRNPGRDIKLVSVDGQKDALQAIIDGKLGASVENNPRYGPTAYDILEKYAAGGSIPAKIIQTGNFYESSNAKEFLGSAY